MTQAQTSLKNDIDPNLNYKKMADAIRILAVDAVKAANSGHSGMPMGMADIATILCSKFLKFDPQNPSWANRDRFIVSNGHGSMLLYALAYLTGYDAMPIEEIKNFRQLHSKTPGHPEIDVSIGVETTTGPLGQGISNAVGFALAERILHARNPDQIDHYTYVFAGDGCMMEGVSHEACSLSGHQKLSKLIVFYDDNGITIDGKTDLTFSENVIQRFESYGWDTQSIDGHDTNQIEQAIIQAQSTGTPSLIACKTKIGFAAPTQESHHSAHGAITKDEEIAGIRKNLGWDRPPFEIPQDILDQWRSLGVQSNDQSTLDVDLTGLDTIIADLKSSFASEKPKKATRQTSGACLEKLIAAYPFMIGGSADLTGSNNTQTKSSTTITPDTPDGNYINYGVREHGMAAAMNGMALHGGLIPYAGTFLQFSDYARPSIRLAALMKQQVIHVMTHDSIGLGEDGPTHQPVEHIPALRAIPNCYVYRPCDGIETAECWQLALNKKDAPAILALTRQGIPTVCDNRSENFSAKGAYILQDSEGDPDVTLFASGSEVHLALDAASQINANVRVVSVPCMDLFFEQDGSYIQSLVCNKSIKIGIEASVRQGWDAIIGAHSTFIGMNSFGDSAPADILFKHYGITVDAIVEAAHKRLQKN